MHVEHQAEDQTFYLTSHGYEGELAYSRPAADVVDFQHTFVDEQLRGQVAGRGSSTQRQGYEYTDTDAATAAYYRLRQLDTDGTASYGPVQYVPAGAAPALTLYPNPTTGEVRIDGLPATAQVQLTLHTAPGRTVLSTQQLTPAEASAQLSAALRPAAPGLYVLTVLLDGRPQHVKVVKE